MSSYEDFDAIVSQFAPEDLEIEIEERMELASHDPILVDLVDRYILQAGQALEQVDMDMLYEYISKKYDLDDPVYFVEAWNICVSRLENVDSIDFDTNLTLGTSVEPTPSDKQEISDHDLPSAYELIESVVWSFVYRDRHASKLDICLAAKEVCGGLRITEDEVADLVESLIALAETERDGRGHFIE